VTSVALTCASWPSSSASCACACCRCDSRSVASVARSCSACARSCSFCLISSAFISCNCATSSAPRSAIWARCAVSSSANSRALPRAPNGGSFVSCPDPLRSTDFCCCASAALGIDVRGAALCLARMGSLVRCETGGATGGLSSTQNCQSSGAAPHSAGGDQPPGGVHPAGGVGQFGGLLKRIAIAASSANPQKVHHLRTCDDHSLCSRLVRVPRRPPPPDIAGASRWQPSDRHQSAGSGAGPERRSRDCPPSVA
jgi:hypothetical protein